MPDARPPTCDVTVYGRDAAHTHRGVPLERIVEFWQSSRETGRVWIDLEIADRSPVVPILARLFPIHPVVEDVLLQRDHRPSVSVYSEFTHLILDLVHVERELTFEKIDVLCGPQWLVTLQGRPGDCFGSVRSRLRDSERFRDLSAPFLMHALAESACREYLRILERFGARLEQLELRLITRPSPGVIHRIHAAKRELRGMRRATVPLRESIETLFFSNRAWTGAVTDGGDLHLALREIHDELGGVIDVLDAYADATHNLTDLYIASSSNRVNDILRVLTIISTIFIPLSFIAGVYGMNFTHMPELHWTLGYPLALGVMAIVALAFLAFFWRRGWLRRSDIPKVPSITRASRFLEDTPS